MKTNTKNNTVEAKKLVNKNEIKNNAGNAGMLAKPNPLPLKDHELEPPMSFHERLLPKSIRRYILDTAYSLDNTAPDFLAVSIISMMAALIGSNVEIKPKRKDDWSVPCIIWTMIVGKASEKKSPAINKIKANVDDIINTQLKPKTEKQVIAYESKSRIYNNKRSSLEKSLDKAYEDDNIEKAIELQDKIEQLKKPTKPILREVYVNDSTIEALKMSLESNPIGILMLCDELSGLIATFNQPSRSHERSVYLEGFNGARGNHKVSRVTRDDVELELMFISIFGGIQPDMLQPLISKALTGEQNDGFLERFLQMSVYPLSSESKVTDHLVESSDKSKIKHILSVLASLNCPYEPLELKFDYMAQKKWDKWANEALDDQKRAPKELESFCAKRTAHCAKLALVFHLLEEADKTGPTEGFTPSLIVGVESINRAMVWMRYLKTHAERIMLSGKTQGVSNSSAKTLISRLEKLYPEFTKHELSQKGWKNLTTAEQRTNALEKLENLGYIQRKKVPCSTNNNVSKLSSIYLVHPNYKLGK